MANSYQPGDVYFSTFPKFAQLSGTKDFNMDSQKDNPSPRPLVVLEQATPTRIIAAPVTSDLSNNHDIYDSYVPLKKGDYPAFLKKDSFIKMNQIQPVDTRWLYTSSSGQPRLVGRLKPLDLERAQYFSLYATQTQQAYSKWVSEIVSKNVKNINQHELEREIAKSMSLPAMRSDHRTLPGLRGDIVEAHFQPTIPNPSSERLKGLHNAIILTDGKYTHIPPGQAYVVPVVPQSNEFKSLMTAHDKLVMVNSKPHIALVGQLQPMNRQWMGNKVGALHPVELLEVDRSVITTLGLKSQVLDMSRKVILSHIQKQQTRSR